MFGHYTFGDAAFGALPDTAVMARGSASVVGNFSYTVYAASSELITASDDTPASQPFLGTLSQPIDFKRSLVGTTLGQFTTGDGHMVLDNGDAGYDNLPGSYSIDGRDITIKLSRQTDNYSSSFIIFKGTAADWLVDETTLTVTLRDYGYKLNVPLQTNLYGGTGGIDGDANTIGLQKPRAFGQLLNVPALLIVASLLIYQVNDGQISAVSAVYDRGVPLSFDVDYATYALLAAATVAPGNYATCLAQGYFRIGASPTGTVTADISGDASSSGYVETSAAIVRRIVTLATVLVDPDDLYLPAFTSVAAAQAAAVGYWNGPNDTVTVADVLANIMTGVGGWAGFRRNGKLEVGLMLAPAAPPVARFDRNDISSITREALPTDINPVPWRHRVGYQRNWTTQTDLAAGVSATRKAFSAVQYRYAEASDTSIKANHPFALDASPVNAYFAVESDATTEAQRLLDLYSASRGLYRVTVYWPAFQLNLGECVTVTYPRWDLSVGRTLRIVELVENGKDNTVQFVGYG